MSKFRKVFPKILSFLMVAVMAVVIFAGTPADTVKAEYLPQEKVTRLDASIKSDVASRFNEEVVQKLPSAVKDDDDISVIVDMKVKSLLDVYNEADSAYSVYQYSNTREGRLVNRAIESEKNRLLKIIRRSDIDFKLGESYETLLSGFEVTIKAKNFQKLNNLLSEHATLIVGEVYNPCESVVVKNLVDVYDTGIFDSSKCEYQGDGVVVAVLDTGLDYTHTAFNPSEENFTTSNEKFTLDSVASVIDDTVASTLTRGLTAEDVYVSRKVPYAYDYGDQDPDVLPIDSEHGTHVAGVIAGKDDTITGVAPNAQLAIMKVFSDTRQGARTSALLAALEDCVILGVDVINMSLGTGCGFTREVDKENVNLIYDKIHQQGISLIASAANSYNATFGSDKNGSNGLTSNPDSGTVGSPSTYNGPLSVASVDGVETPYILYGDDIIYFNEASTNDAEQKKDFVDDVLKAVGGVDSYDFTYVTIPGVGKTTDYAYADNPDYYKGKIVLVKRGQTTFEEKVRVALRKMGAAGIIIYNNVSGTISMAVGADVGAVCSISQDDGEKLAKSPTGTITISRNNTAGPFMSDFSSWGPTSDLKIKPEITAHGGEILSAVPGQGYERLSGTSMAAPNQAGATALIRQYVTYSGVFGQNLGAATINSLVNKLMMSTADIVINKNGLPYAVRKQGAGLVNINKATTTASYVTTYDTDGKVMDKTKLELGDDKQRTGVYEMTFDITNVSRSNVSYDVSSIVMTEGVSSTYTGHGDRTVSQDGRLLDGASAVVTHVANCSQNGNVVSIKAGETGTVTVRITLSEEDKQYLADSFEHGMYVEGYVTLTAKSGTEVNMNVPLLAFYGDWTEAPIFDEEYYDTNKDELDKGLDDNDKLMADAYATRVIGGTYSDYIITLGTYPFVQDKDAIQIPANKDHIALSNQERGEDSAINTIRSINAGLLRNAKQVDITITEDSTGEVIFKHTEYNQLKSFSSGNTIYASSIDVDFSVLKHNLKNNAKYTVKAVAYIDYGTHEEQKNVKNVFEFPMYIDFEAPAVEDVIYRTEYDKSTKKTKLYADIYVYDNHYAMGMSVGQIVRAPEGSEYTFSMNSFGKYVTPVYSSYNSTSIVTVELTDYVSQIKKSAGIKYLADGTSEVVENTNSFVVTCYDYAMNNATYELQLPDEIKSIYFEEESLTLSPGENKTLDALVHAYPNTSWVEVLDYESSDDNVCDVVNRTLIAKQSGNAVITATGKSKDGTEVKASINVKVLKQGDEGYVDHSRDSKINKFELTGYKTNKSYYGVVSEDREIGKAGYDYVFKQDEYTLSMFPSESVTLKYKLDSYFPNSTRVEFKAGSDKVTVSEDGTIVAQKKGTANVSVTVYYDNGTKETREAFKSVSVTVKDPFKITAIYLNNYRGLGGEVVIPDNRGITTIYDYAFSGYEYVDKDENDEISEEDPYLIKQHYLGDDTITKVVIPEGVTTINSYAFANLTALEEVVVPSTLTKIGLGAFYNCTSLKKISSTKPDNANNIKFINQKAFYNCALSEINLQSVVAIGNYTFENCKLNYIELPETAQSLGIGAFYNNDNLTSVQFNASKIKIGSYAFAECEKLESIDINSVVLSSYAFYNSKALKNVTLGKDVAVIGQYAFTGTAVDKFSIDSLNPTLKTDESKAIIEKTTADGKELVLVAPNYAGVNNVIETDATSIAVGAFSGNVKVYKIIANNVKTIANYAFAGCSNLREVSLDSATVIGDYAFAGDTKLTVSPNLSNVKSIGKYAFYATFIKELTLPDNCVVDNYAFALMPQLEKVTVGNNVGLGEGAFFCPMNDFTYEKVGSFAYYTRYTYEVKDENGKVIESYDYYRYNPTASSVSVLKTVEIGDNVKIGTAAFAGNVNLQNLTMGEGAEIGDRAFYNDSALTSVDFSKVRSIGVYAFSGQRMNDYWLYKNTWSNAYERQYIDGEVKIVGYLYASYAPRITSADLSKVETVGEGAFAFNDKLASVKINENATKVSDYAFAYCTALTSLTLSETVTEIGDYAFMKTNLESVDLSKVETLGEGAFARTALKSVKLAETSYLGDDAFAYCYYLGTVDNLNGTTYIGANAFNGTKLTALNLEKAETIGDYAFANSQVTEVTLGDNVKELGENPFGGCKIKTFGRYEDIVFGGKVIGKELNENFTVSDSVYVIDGVLYRALPNGMKELVSYPVEAVAKTYEIAEGTSRISATAFAGSKLSNVVLPSTLKAIGHKAFYNMENLSSVTFLSLDAPVLEEEYDESVLTYNNLPISGSLGTMEGIGIVGYYMWNVTSRYDNFYFGANFSDYVGHVTRSIIMIRPSNGQNYDSFIFSKYFSEVALGKPARTEKTNAAIELIKKIPSNVTLDAEQTVKTAREAYDGLTTEQQSLIDKDLIETLTGAESLIDYLKNQNVKPEPPKPAERDDVLFVNSPYFVAIMTVAGTVIGCAVVLVVLAIRQKKRNTANNA